MKISDHVIYNTGDFNKMLDVWDRMAYQIGAEYGVYIKTILKSGEPKSIVFAIDDKEFDSAQELRKALDNKAFI